MKYAAIILMFTFANLLTAQDYGDAPASYGLAGAVSSYAGSGRLGVGVTMNDTSNPVTPAWTGDADDGIVGSPLWNSWSSLNQLTVHIEGDGYLYMFVDADDSGTFEQSELYTYARATNVSGPADVTFRDIKLNKLGGYSLNGTNKVAVRIMFLDQMGAPPPYQPSFTAYLGEVEDWLIDVSPPVLTVSLDTLADAEANQTYDASFQPINGTGPYTWALAGGSLPTGLSLVQLGDNFELGGTPAASSAGVYTFDVQVTDSASAIAIQSLSLRVLPTPYALPFTDNFSTDKHWTMGNEWSIGAATGFAGTGVTMLGYPAVEPSVDSSPGNSDNMLLMSSTGAEEPDRPWVDYAVSPKINCSGISNIQLEFRRWYSLSASDRTAIEITSDGQTWDEVWTVPSNGYMFSVADVAWSKIQVDISQWAANKPWVRLRWKLGIVQHHYSATIGFCGWSIDDVVVRKTPMSSPLIAHGFVIDSLASFQNQQNMLWYPIVFPGSTHDFTILVDNLSAEPVTITSLEGYVKFEAPPGSTPYYTDMHVVHGDLWYDFGTWTLDQSVTIPASATNVALTGKLDFQGGPSPYLANIPYQAYVDLIGTHGTANTPVEIRASDEFVPSAGPMPGIYLYEAQAGTTPIDNGQTAVNLRDFGSIAVNWSSNWLNIVIDHTSSSTSNLGTPTITGADAGQFTINTNNYANQLVGNSATTYFSLVFKPTSAGQKTAIVTFTHDAPNTGTPFIFEITGFGVGNGPVLKVFEGTTSGPQLGNGSPANGGRDFGQVDIVAGTGQLTIAVENQGNQDLILGAPTLTGAGAGEFSLNLTGMVTTVSAAGSTTFLIDFDPSAIGIFTATIEFIHNDPGTASAFIINITGEGIVIAPIVEVREGTLYGPVIAPGASAAGGRDFGSVTVGTTTLPSYNVIIFNTGWANLTLGTAKLTGTNAASFSLELTRYFTTRGSGQYSVIVVSFDPLAKGLKTATLEFSHNDSNVVSPFTLDFKGVGDDPNGVQVASTIMLEAREGNSYSDVLQASGGTGPYTWVEVSTTLNSGLTIDSDGTIHGTPVNGDGNYNTFQVMATDALGGTEYGIVKIRIQPPIGFLGKGPNGLSSGGCASNDNSGIWLWGLLALATLAAVKRRRRATSRVR